jgi:murein DD-endopeptidase MepM/ murein hydrolase activator NlpD
MKYVGVLLLGMLLGALGYRELAMQRSTTLAMHPDCSSACPAATPAATANTSTSMPAPPPVMTDTQGQASPAITPIESPPSDSAISGEIDAPLAGLSIPVQGTSPSQLADTFADARSEGRSHDAIDIMAAAGTPVLAVANGHVEKLFDSERGGLTIYQFEPSGRYAYYYAHLQRYADGLAEKQSIKRGQVIGYVGSTGNADPAAPHLHFAIFLLGPERRWWEGTAINPYPVLTQRHGGLK